MEELEVYFTEHSDLRKFEAESKGYRNDVFVKIKGKYYQLAVYDIVRLKQDFEAEIDSNGYYQADPNLIIVDRVILSSITHTIDKLKGYFFDKLKPIEFTEIKEGLIKVYP